MALGGGRTLEALLNRYRNEKESGRRVPTTRLATLADWSRHFGWQARLLELADRAAKEAEEREAERRRQIMESGYGLASDRVELLKRLAGKLRDELESGGRLWVREIRSLGRAGTVEVERFNSPEMEQLRGLLDDIAREKGERATVGKQDVKLSGEMALQIVPWTPNEPEKPT